MKRPSVLVAAALLAARAAGQYREGVTDFLALLDAQRTQLAAESAVAYSEGEVNGRVVGIYKALGGLNQPARAPVLANRVDPPDARRLRR